MMLSDRDLHDRIRSGSIRITPFDPEMIQPASIDVRLDRTFIVTHTLAWTNMIDPAIRQDEFRFQVTIPDGEPFTLLPGWFALGSTVERIELDGGLAARIEGKSSLGRLGLMVHSTAGFIDPGFQGNLTLELSNVAPLPIKLWPGMKIGQICVMRLNQPANRLYGDPLYGSHYQGQRGPVPSASWRGFRTWPLSQGNPD